MLTQASLGAAHWLLLLLLLPTPPQRYRLATCACSCIVSGEVFTGHALTRPLQAFAGIVTVSVGHCHPEVNKAVIEQTQRLQVGLCLCADLCTCCIPNRLQVGLVYRTAVGSTGGTQVGRRLAVAVLLMQGPHAPC